MTATAAARRHPLVSFFALTYGLSWGAALIVLGASHFNLVELSPVDTGFIFVSMLLGPSVSGLMLTALLEGRLGLRRLGASLLKWRVGTRWYALALLVMPLLLFATLWLLSVFVDAAFVPRFQWPLFAIGAVAGTFEEIGWTGFATQRLLARHRPFIAGLLLGLAWALWHALVDFRQNFHVMGITWLLEFAIFYVATLTAYRLLMTRVYANTQSLLLAVLMHASYTGWLFALYPGTSFQQGLIWQTVLAIGLWLAVAVGFRKPMPPRSTATAGRTVNLSDNAAGPRGDKH
jgi:membrane protease YdiL (CAAX protease family)